MMQTLLNVLVIIYFLKFKKFKIRACLSQHVSCFLDGGNLLKHPSAAMTKLINSVDKASCRFTEAEREKALQRPVMSFICQRHDLDGLQLAMRQALRKATCRVFAMQVMFLGQLPANISMQSTLFNPYQSYICFSPKMLYAYYICCIYSNAPKATFIMTANSLSLDQREQSYLDPYCLLLKLPKFISR